MKYKYIFALTVFHILFCTIFPQEKKQVEDHSVKDIKKQKKSKIIQKKYKHSNSELRIVEKRKGKGIRGTYSDIILHKEENETARKLSDVLQNQADIQVNRLGGVGSFSSVSIRGTSSHQTGIYLDGVLLNDLLGGSINLEDLPLEMFRKVEVYQSYTPSHLLGIHIGGAVDLLPKKSNPQEKNYIFSHLYPSSLIGLKMGVGLSYQNTLNYVFIEGSLNRYKFLNNNSTSIQNTEDDRIETRENEGYRSVGYTGLFYFDEKKYDVDILFNYHGKQRGIPGTVGNPLKRVSSINHHLLSKISYNLPLNKNVEGKILLFLEGAYTNLLDPEKEMILNLQTNDKRLWGNITTGWQSIWSILPEVLSWHSSIMASFSKAVIQLENDWESIAQRNQVDIGSSLEYEPFYWLGRAAVTFKVDQIYDRPQEGLQNVYLTSQISDPVYSPLFSGSALLAFYPMGIFMQSASAFEKEWNRSKQEEQSYEIYLLVTYTGRHPGIAERYGNGELILPNPKLVPENGLVYTVGWKNTFEFKQFKLESDINFFQQNIDQLILFVFISDRALRAENVSATLIRGIESASRFQWGDHFLTVLKFALLSAKDKGNFPFYRDKFLPFKPRYKIIFYNEGGVSFLKLFMNFFWQGITYRDRFNSEHKLLPNRFRLDMGIIYYFDSEGFKLSFTFSVKNILNDLTRDIIGYPLPGIVYEIKTSGKFNL